MLTLAVEIGKAVTEFRSLGHSLPWEQSLEISSATQRMNVRLAPFPNVGRARKAWALCL